MEAGREVKVEAEVKHHCTEILKCPTIILFSLNLNLSLPIGECTNE